MGDWQASTPGDGVREIRVPPCCRSAAKPESRTKLGQRTRRSLAVEEGRRKSNSGPG